MRASLPRTAILVAAALFFAALAATITFAAAGGSPPPAVVPGTAPPAAETTLVVPDVRRQPYVFAKGTLEEGGFAWRIAGGAQGFAANPVVAQSPAPGTRVVDTGFPLVTLTLGRNPAYKQEGTPENASNYRGTAVRLAGVAAVRRAPKAKPKPAAATPKSAAKPALPQKRPPAFTVAGATPEPLDELPLPDRAAALARWVEQHPKISPRNVDHWLYQHSWIVTGARMGWWRGAEALRALVRVDKRVEQLWGVGGRSADLAAAALAEVEAQAR